PRAVASKSTCRRLVVGSTVCSRTRPGTTRAYGRDSARWRSGRWPAGSLDSPSKRPQCPELISSQSQNVELARNWSCRSSDAVPRVGRADRGRPARVERQQLRFARRVRGEERLVHDLVADDGAALLEAVRDAGDGRGEADLDVLLVCVEAPERVDRIRREAAR